MEKQYKRQYFITLISTLIALVVLVAYTFTSFYSNSASNMHALGKSSLKQETEQLQSYLTKGMDVLQVTAITVEYMMQDGLSPKEIEEFLTEESKRYMEDIDENFTGIYGYVSGEYIDGIGWVPDNDYVPTEREWYIAAKEAGGKPTLVSPYLDAQTNTIMISVSRLLYDGESVISFDIALNRLQVITHSISLDNMGYGFIVDGNGMVVAHNDEGEKGKNYYADESMRALMGKLRDGEETFELKIDGEQCTIFADTIMDDWYVVMIVSNTRLFEEIRVVMIQNVIICVIVFLLITVFTTFSFHRLRASVKIENESRSRLERMNVNIVRALARTIDAKDRYTNGHSQRVAAYSVEIAVRMGKTPEEQEEIYYAGLLHDVGKIRVPESVINKPGRLTNEEFEFIKLHPVAGYHILKDIYEDKEIALGAKFHHERYDGRGYPSGLAGENIPEIARIIGVADAYDAMASNRSYREALPQEAVRSEIEKGRGAQFDPRIADIMLQMIDEDSEYRMKQEQAAKKTILITDSEQESAEEVCGTISSTEYVYTVLKAENAAQTMDILSQTPVDMVLLDVNIPDMDGFELLKKIKENYSVRVVLVTADKSADSLRRAADLGADDYVTKPVLPTALKEVLRSLLNE